MPSPSPSHTVPTFYIPTAGAVFLAIFAGALAVALMFTALSVPSESIAVSPAPVASEHEARLERQIETLWRELAESDARNRRTLEAMAGSSPVPTVAPSRDVREYTGPR